MQKLCATLLLGLLVMQVFAQPTFPVNGVQDKRESVFALTGGVLHVEGGKTISGGTIIIEQERITAVGPENSVTIPEGAVVYPLYGKHVYPSFIDLYSDYGMPEPEVKKVPTGSLPPQISTKAGPFGWNEAIRPEVRAAELFSPDKDAAAAWRKLGFGAVVSHQPDGIIRGTGALTLLGDGIANALIASPDVAAFYSFNKGTSKQAYPSSLMGAIALIRQTYYDAQWYDKARALDGTGYHASLEAMKQLQSLPVIFTVRDVLTAFRALRISKEFNHPFIMKGSGDDYQKLAAIKAAGVPLLLPLTFPAPFDVSDPYAANQVALRDMMHWERAPANAAILANAGVPFAFTLDGLQDKKTFWAQLRKVHEYGLSDSAVLHALTASPAALIGVDKDYGTLAAGKMANLFIASYPILHPEIEVLENWVAGKRYTVTDYPAEDRRGTYALIVDGDSMMLTIRGRYLKPTAKLTTTDSLTWKATIEWQKDLVHLSILTADSGGQSYRLTGIIDQQWKGDGIDGNGHAVQWIANRIADFVDTSTISSAQMPDFGPVPQPFVGYGWQEAPSQVAVLFRRATVWTGEDIGILRETDVLIRNGIIEAIGANLQAENARVIDATGKHLTAGIIDEHSHIAISRGVNEGTHAVTAEVSIADVINSEDVNLYRQLAGGVTAAQLLHGSANPIGGQSAIIKFRWGSLPEEMKMSFAPPFIKFALGENVKQSNWGDEHDERFPQTRMGVEQVFYDAFHRAAAYLAAWDTYRQLSRREKELAIPPRRDLTLEALGEILLEERFITCHSYVQSEINMLMKVADSFGFTLNTFTHILEGYKVADKMAAHGAGASTFSDWWAYKYEVIDAIPYNAAILTQMGVTTAINSDDAEMGRRLNQEAAKSMKYGGLSEEEAWALVTLNPAKLLQIDHRVGSIRQGKDADLVLWDNHPLSVYAQPLQTYVDGRLLFDQSADEAQRAWIVTERNRLIQAMIKAKAKGAKARQPVRKEPKLYHCDDWENELDQYEKKRP